MALPATEWCNSCDNADWLGKPHKHNGVCMRRMYKGDFYCACPNGRPIAFLTRSDGIDYTVCPKCINRRQFSGNDSDVPIYKIGPGEIAFCESCGEAFKG